MLIFFTDESTIHGKEFKEYGLSIYGGIILDESTFNFLTDYIYKLKSKYRYPQQIEFKWRFEDVWEQMVKEEFVVKGVTKKDNPDVFQSVRNEYNTIKSEIINQVSKTEAKIVVAIRPGGLLATSHEKNIEYAIGAIAKKFETILEREGQYGIMLADELPKKLVDKNKNNYEYILNICCKDSVTKRYPNLISIVPTVCSYLSPIHQINDIVLGVIQYYILEFIRVTQDENHNMDTARNLFRELMDNFYTSYDGNHVLYSGMLIYPPSISRRPSRATTFLNNLELQFKNDFDII